MNQTDLKDILTRLRQQITTLQQHEARINAIIDADRQKAGQHGKPRWPLG